MASVWTALEHNDPSLLDNFESFLSEVVEELHQSQSARETMEHHIKKCVCVRVFVWCGCLCVNVCACLCVWCECLCVCVCNEAWLLMTTPPRVLDRHHKEASEYDDLVQQHMCEAEESIIMKVSVCVWCVYMCVCGVCVWCVYMCVCGVCVYGVYICVCVVCVCVWCVYMCVLACVGMWVCF